MSHNLELFPHSNDRPAKSGYRPLADKLRPSRWDDFFGDAELDPKLMQRLKSAQGVPPSLILWGPPGSGKTTLARLIGQSFDCRFVAFSAVLGGVKEVRDIVQASKTDTRQTLLFVDEIHRFNRAQQDAFLPHIEDGTLVLVGATTENPSFYLTAALLSRCRVLVLPKLSDQALSAIALRAEAELGFSLEESARRKLVHFAAGDARRLLNALEGLRQSLPKDKEVNSELLAEFFAAGAVLFYDRAGEEHYNIISAFIKSLRGSDPDAALYWGFRMLQAGEDALFIIRRMIIFASEDIGNADPQALTLAVSTMQAFEALGLPEGRIPIAHCITYLASAPKSNRSYVGMLRAIEAVKETPKVLVPLHLRNAPTNLMKGLGYGKGYLYPHDDQEAASGQQYLPDELVGKRFYEP